MDKKKHRGFQFSLLALLLVVCVSVGLLMRGYRREQASRELILALKAKDTDRALDALRAHADPNVRDQGNVRPSLRGYLSTLWQQMRGIKPPPEKGSTALGLAVYQGNTVLVEALLARGAKDVNDTLPGNGRMGEPIPLLAYAVERSNSVIVEALLKHGWNANTVVKIPDMDYGIPVLHCVNDVATAKILLAYGADIHARETNGNTALDVVLGVEQRPDVVEALLDAGAGDARAVVDALRSGDSKVLKRLFAQGWTINRAESGGATPLIYALRPYYADIPVALLLIRQGANVNCQDKDGRTPLLCAAYSGCANSTVPMDPRSPTVVAALLGRGARVDVQDDLGRTPLMVAAHYLRLPLVQLLLKHSARVNMRTKQGETALSFARDNDISGSKSLRRMQAEVIQLLKQAGAKE